MSVQPSVMSSTAPTVGAIASIARHCEKLLTGAALTIALSLAVQGMHSPAHGNEVSAANRPTITAHITSESANIQSLPDGAYLYGQAIKAEQIGATYLVFEVNRGKVAGAFYMPQSSFDCVHGTVQSQQLALTVVNSYEQASYPYTVALQTGTASASVTQPTVPPLGLEGYYPMQQLSTSDRHMLSVCKTNDAKRL